MKKSRIKFNMHYCFKYKNVNKYIHMEKLKETITKNNVISRGVGEYCEFQVTFD